MRKLKSKGHLLSPISLLQVQVFCAVTPYGFLIGYQRFRGSMDL